MSGTPLPDTDEKVPGWWVNLVAAVVKQLPRPGTIDQTTAEGWEKNQKALKKALNVALCPSEGIGTVSGEVAETTSILRSLVRGLRLNATDGKGMIGKANDVFTGYIDGDCKNYGCNVAGNATPESAVDLYEMVQDATFAQMFGSLGGDLNSLCLSQDQIIQFCRTHRDQLRTDGYATFFLFKVGESFFVAYVSVFAGGLRVFVRHFAYGRVWDGGYRRRVVVPQRTPVAVVA